MFKIGEKVKAKDSQPDDELALNSIVRGKVYEVEDIDVDSSLIHLSGGVVAFDDRFELVQKKYSLKKFEKDIRKFNERCGNIDCTPNMDIEEVCATVLPQAKVILEESKELLKACEDNNEQELIDGAVDVLVTSMRLLSLLGKRYDLMEAARLVMENNHLKYTDDLLLVQSWLAGTTYKISVANVGGKSYYCMKNDHGKILKYEGFPKVSLNVDELKIGNIK